MSIAAIDQLPLKMDVHHFLENWHIKSELLFLFFKKAYHPFHYYKLTPNHIITFIRVETSTYINFK